MAEKSNPESNKSLSTEPYKGVRDFYPEDQAIQTYIFTTWRRTVESFGFVEYNASILEPAELYRAKTGDEIINEQTYTFIDRGEREVTLRPEMTPSVARMIAARKRELSFPLRWYSIQNFFRYERPQRGRVREFWQLNCDVFGVDSLAADSEILQLAYRIMKSFGARDGDFIIKVNSRKAIVNGLKNKGLSEEQIQKVLRLRDKKEKMAEDQWNTELREIAGQEFNMEFEYDKDILHIIESLKSLGIANIEYDSNLERGFDYYTGMVFEVRDTNPENKRALFGGGRFDDLLSLFGEEKVPAVGFGMGDVTMRDFLEVRNLLPQFASTARITLCNAGIADEKLFELATSIREKGINVAVDLSRKKIGDQIKKAVKDAVEFAAVIGEDELASGRVRIKHLASEKEEEVNIPHIADYIEKF